jgi:hypothetical protein
MNKQTIITILLALVTVAGQGQVKCHVEGTLETHPIHNKIATAETAYRMQPGKPYIDYMVRNTDGQLVPISTLTKGKVALIDLWASW